MHLSRQLGRLRRLPRRLRSLLFVKITDVVYVLDLRDYRPARAPAGPGVEVRPARASDEAALAQAFGDAKANELVSRLGACFGTLGFHEGRVVGYSWMTDQPRAREGEHPFFYDVAPRPGWFYFFDTFVSPSARGLGLATLLKRGLIEEALRRGGRYCLATHGDANAAVIHVSEKLGFKLHGRMHYTRFLGFTRQDLTGLPEGMRA
jgi:GNAT superfamily N-acetyltransferase